MNNIWERAGIKNEKIVKYLEFGKRIYE